VKEVIYLDTNYLHSYISQIEDGLITNMNKESTEEITEQNELQKGSQTESFIEGKFSLGEIEIPLLFKSPTGEVSSGISPIFSSNERISLSQLESGREIISKKLHDDALKRFEEYMENKQLFNTQISDIKQGDYINIKSRFRIIDFNYMKKAFNPDKLVELMYYEQEQEIKKFKNKIDQLKGQEKTLNRQKLKEIESKHNKEKKITEEDFKFLQGVLEYISDILPSDSFLLADNLLLPLKSSFLRESSKDLTFKYGAKKSTIDITIVGKVTRKVDDVELPEFKGNHAHLEFGEILYFLLNTIGILQKGNYIVSPIAIYFE